MRWGNWESQEPEMVAWVEKTFRYNVPHGKLNRGLAVVAGEAREPRSPFSLSV